MQTQLHVQPLELSLPSTQPRVRPHHDLPDLIGPSSLPILDKATPPVPQSGPHHSVTPHPLRDDQVPHSKTRDQASFTSPQQSSISASKQTRPTPLLPPGHSPHLDPIPCPALQTHPLPHFSPSPPSSQTRPAPLFPPPHSAPHYQSHFASSAISCAPNMDPYSIANLGDRHLRGTDKYPLLEQRRMSEPAMYGNAASGYSTSVANLSNARHHQLQHQYSYVPPQSYATHSSPLRRPSDTRPIASSPWKEDHHIPLHPYDSIELEEPLSPLNPTFSGGESPSMSGLVFGSLREDYGSSPPGTGTSTSSTAPTTHQSAHATDDPSSTSNGKQYAFVSLPGNVVKKRPRRRYDEIERLYQCSWPDCTKSYGTLNHLNAHITMQKHGSKRSPNEFKELRKQWRKAKKEEAETRALDATQHGSHQTQQYHVSPHSLSSAHYQTQNIYAHHPTRSPHSIGSLDDLDSPVHHQRSVYARRPQRYGPFVSPHLQHGEITYPHPHSHGTNVSNIHMNRLPANSTLLTPLPGYEPTPDPNAYDPYRSSSLPRTGHANSVGHGDRGRPRSGHVDFGTGHHRDYS